MTDKDKNSFNLIPYKLEDRDGTRSIHISPHAPILPVTIQQAAEELGLRVPSRIGDVRILARFLEKINTKCRSILSGTDNEKKEALLAKLRDRTASSAIAKIIWQKGEDIKETKDPQDMWGNIYINIPINLTHDSEGGGTKDWHTQFSKASASSDDERPEVYIYDSVNTDPTNQREKFLTEQSEKSVETVQMTAPREQLQEENEEELEELYPEDEEPLEETKELVQEDKEPVQEALLQEGPVKSGTVNDIADKNSNPQIMSVLQAPSQPGLPSHPEAKRSATGGTPRTTNISGTESKSKGQENTIELDFYNKEAHRILVDKNFTIKEKHDGSRTYISPTGSGEIEVSKALTLDDANFTRITYKTAPSIHGDTMQAAIASLFAAKPTSSFFIFTEKKEGENDQQRDDRLVDAYIRLKKTGISDDNIQFKEKKGGKPFDEPRIRAAAMERKTPKPPLSHQSFGSPPPVISLVDTAKETEVEEEGSKPLSPMNLR